MIEPQNTLDKIYSHGYWRVVVRPTLYNEQRVLNILELMPILERVKVSLRGWDFPHIDYKVKQLIYKNWIEQSFDWYMYVEFWRFYQSGQFIYFDGNREDWFGQKTFAQADSWTADARLAAVSSLYRFAEIFEFAARLALTPAGDKVMSIDIELKGLTGRKLWMDDPNRGSFFQDYIATIPSFSFHNEYTSDDLASKGRELSMVPAQELFRRFGWDAKTETVATLLKGLYHDSAA